MRPFRNQIRKNCIESLRNLSQDVIDTIQKRDEMLLDLARKPGVPDEMFLAISDNLRHIRENLFNILHLSEDMGIEKKEWEKVLDYISTHMMFSASIYETIFIYKEEGKITAVEFDDYKKIFEDVNFYTNLLLMNVSRARHLLLS